MLKNAFLVLLLGGAICAPALAKHVPVDAQRGAYGEQRARVEAALADGETYSEIGTAERSAVLESLKRIDDLLGGRQAHELAPAEHTLVTEEQGRLNAMLNKASEDSRLVCKRERAVGSNFATSQCMTVAQRRRQREDSQNSVMRSTPRGTGLSP
jgi:hypothetical protein